MEDADIGPSLPRQIRASLASSAGVVAVVAALYGLVAVTAGRPLLLGEHAHDFGIVEIAGPPVAVEHSFVLANRTDRTIQIREVRTSCGCSVASCTPSTVEPGGLVRVNAKLTLSHDGRKSAAVYLLCGEDGTDTLRLQAAGRHAQRLVVPAGTAPLRADGPLRRIVQYEDYDSEAEPPALAIDEPPGVRASFSGWERLRRRDPGAGLPARWQGALDLEPTGEPITAGAVLILRVADQTMGLALRSAPAESGSREGQEATDPIALVRARILSTCQRGVWRGMLDRPRPRPNAGPCVPAPPWWGEDREEA